MKDFVTTQTHTSLRLRAALATLALLTPFHPLPEAQAQDSWSSAGPSGHAPIGVLGDHTHGAGEWMFAYIYQRLTLAGLRDGTSSVSTDEACIHHHMVPLSIGMDVHMPHVMHTPSRATAWPWKWAPRSTSRSTDRRAAPTGR